MKDYYVLSTSCSIKTRHNAKNGTVYDACFRIIDAKTGKTIQKRIGGFKSRSGAKTAHAEFLLDYCDVVKVNPFNTVEEKQTAPIFARLFDEYMQNLHLFNKDSVIYDKQKVFARFILPRFGAVPVDTLTVETLRAWQSETLQAKSERGGTITVKYFQKIRSHLGAFLAWVQENYGYKNYLPDLKRPVDRNAKKVFSFWDEKTFSKFIDSVDSDMYRALFTTMFYTGRRKGEIFALKPSDVDLTNRTIKWTKSLTRKVLRADGDEKVEQYKITTTKEGKIQTLPICPKLAAALESYKPGRTFYFGGDEPLQEKTVTRAFNKYCKISGVEVIRIHDLRHSFASLLVNNHEDYMVVAELIGDTVEQVIETYGHLYPNAIRNAVDRIV